MKEELIRKLFTQLMKQIQFYSDHSIKMKRKLAELKQFDFISELHRDEDNSDTLIFNLVKLKEADPEMFQFYADFMNNNSPLNN